MPSRRRPASPRPLGAAPGPARPGPAPQPTRRPRACAQRALKRALVRFRGGIPPQTGHERGLLHVRVPANGRQPGQLVHQRVHEAVLTSDASGAGAGDVVRLAAATTASGSRVSRDDDQHVDFAGDRARRSLSRDSPRW